jgi:hypothetical protein
MDIKDISNCYAGLGERGSLKSRKLSFFDAPYWRNPVISPIFLTETPKSTREFKILESWFKSHSPVSPYDVSAPYLSILKHPQVQLSTVRELAKQAGWDSQKTKEVRVLYWEKPQLLALPSSVHLEAGSVLNKRLLFFFKEALFENFKRNDYSKFWRALHRLLMERAQWTTIVRLVNQKGDTIACGLVSHRETEAYLFCGSVNRRYRNKGYWRHLVAARQAVSYSNGARNWVLETSNPYLIQSKAKSYEKLTFMPSL